MYSQSRKTLASIFTRRINNTMIKYYRTLLCQESKGCHQHGLSTHRPNYPFKQNSQSLNSEGHASPSYQQADRDGQVRVMREQDDARQEDLARHEERDSKRQIAYREDFEDEESPGADESPGTQRPYQNQDYQRALSDIQDTDVMEAEEREAVYPGYPGGSDTLPIPLMNGPFPPTNCSRGFPRMTSMKARTSCRLGISRFKR
jgi:hypothetical protein